MNGTLVPDDQARVPVTDHGLTTGDGVFEALKVTGGVPFALTRHAYRRPPLEDAAVRTNRGIRSSTAAIWPATSRSVSMRGT